MKEIFHLIQKSVFGENERVCMTNIFFDMRVL